MEKKLTIEVPIHKNKDLVDQECEVWAEHPIYTSVLVSTIGRVKSKDKVVNHNYGGKALKKGKVLAQRLTQKGYLDCGITHDFVTKSIRVHRLVAETFIPNHHNKGQVNHKNGVKTDNRIENLEWCTGSENMQHAWRTGLAKPRTIPKDELEAIKERNYIPVIAYSVNTGATIRFKSVCSAATFLGVCASAVSTSMKRKNKCNGYLISKIQSGLAIEKGAEG